MEDVKIEIAIGTIAEILAIDAQIPEFDQKTPPEKIRNRLEGKVHLPLVARNEGKLVGYKLGYALSESEFYSWHGAVIPTFRKKGIATQLREYQERWALNNGFKTISVKSMNKFPSMLQLLISSGYQIVGYIDEGDPTNSKIQFRKNLKRFSGSK